MYNPERTKIEFFLHGDTIESIEVRTNKLK